MKLIYKVLHLSSISLPISFAQSFRRNNVKGYRKKDKLLFYTQVIKRDGLIECMCDEKFVVLFQNQQKKEKGKLIRDTFRRNTSKLVKDEGSISLLCRNKIYPKYFYILSSCLNKLEKHKAQILLLFFSSSFFKQRKKKKKFLSREVCGRRERREEQQQQKH